MEEIRQLCQQGRSLHQMARQLGMSHQTVANYAPTHSKGIKKG